MDDIKTAFPVDIVMTGEDFSFEMEIDMEMAGRIIEYVAGIREREAKKHRLLTNLK